MADGKPHYWGIYFGGPNDKAISNEISGFSVAGIQVAGPSGIIIKNNNIHSPNSGICGVITETDGVVTGEENILIAYNNIESGPVGQDVAGIWLLSLHGSVTVKYNVVRSEGIGIQVVQAPTGCIVSGNDIVAGSDGGGMWIAGSSNVVIKNNVVLNAFSSGGGIDVWGCNNVEIRENKVHALLGEVAFH